MAGMYWEELSAEERLLAEQAVMNYRALSKTCRRTADGTVLPIAETMAYCRNHGELPRPWRCRRGGNSFDNRCRPH